MVKKVTGTARQRSRRSGPRSSVPAVRRRGNAFDGAYQVIREEILAFRLKPLDPLRESDLAARLGMSRTPVREALRRLEREGLVWFAPYRGAFVSPISIEDVLQIYFLREVLEGSAARLAALRVDPGEVDTLIDQVKALDLNYSSSDARSIASVDSAVHSVVLKAAGQPKLRAIVDQLNEQAIRMKYLGVVVRPRDTRDELLAILRALKEHNPDGAEDAMRAHIWAAREALAGASATVSPKNVIR